MLDHLLYHSTKIFVRAPHSPLLALALDKSKAHSFLFHALVSDTFFLSGAPSMSDSPASPVSSTGVIFFVPHRAPQALFTVPFCAHLLIDSPWLAILYHIFGLGDPHWSCQHIWFSTLSLMGPHFLLVMTSCLSHAARSSCLSCPCPQLFQYYSSAFATTAVVLKLFGPCPAIALLRSSPSS